MERYICIHGHFYQPPRENPWLEAVELQDSAYPYHDWNERITAECYAPNAVARIMDGEGRIVRLVNNYAKMSFNFGPTLLSWLEVNNPEVYQCILEADAESRKNFGGHGSALAQAYNHMILPLANRRDKYTQVLWGIRDFERRFRRTPEGMWLPETAVDLETLDILAELGIRFTILSPYQAARWRNLGDEEWQDAAGGRIDPTRPYLQNLPSGRSINLFFYDGPISRALAFEKLLSQGENLVNRLAGAFSDDAGLAAVGPHRHRRRELRPPPSARRHGPGLRAPVHRGAPRGPADQLRRVPGKASAATGSGDRREHRLELLARRRAVARATAAATRAGRAGTRPGAARCARAWTGCGTRWRSRYEEAAGELLRDPWAARDEYIDVILDRSPENVERFLARHACRELAPERKDRRAQAARIAAARHAHVHQLRLVLRRAFGHRDRPGHSVRRAGHPTGRRAVRLAAGGRLPRTAGAGQEQSAGARRRPRDLREVGQADGHRLGPRGRPLRRQRAV